MPELPEVETMCRGIHSIIGRRVDRVTTPRCRYRPISIRPGIRHIDQRMRGEPVQAVSRLGKRVLIHTSRDVLVLQPKMSGLVSLAEVPDRDHLRLQLDLGDNRLWFWDRRGLGTVELLARGEITQRLVAGRLGPDALEISLDDFRQRLGGTQRPIKVALLDQKLVAGVGNLYASEMLHAAGIHPARSSARVSMRKMAELYAAMRQILLTAIEYEGSTLADGTYRNALNNPGSYQNQHQVYGQAGRVCPKCERGRIRRIVQAQRATFYCPRCQRA